MAGVPETEGDAVEEEKSLPVLVGVNRSVRELDESGGANMSFSVVVCAWIALAASKRLLRMYWCCCIFVEQ